METVIYEKRGRVAYVTLNRPQALNAINRQMMADLAEVWREVQVDVDVWVAILTGAGERAFSAGADLKEAAQRVPEAQRAVFWAEPSESPLEIGRELWKPVIAAINGYALGGGLTLALSCDVRIAVPQAQLGFPEVRWGVPTIVGAIRLPRLVPLGVALEILLTGDTIDAEQAARWGLVNQIVPSDDLMPAAERIAGRLLQSAPIAVRVTKEMALRGLTLPQADAVRLGESLRRLVRETADAAEGPRAFAEKRPPHYQGR
ncbi:MAG: enoyl-CoA hydratase/isomerase family protein [Chloroflexi bacterium]|nr:enoyl-CoA hydratase/isomerase family protein [Chloroflexota bacterium]